MVLDRESDGKYLQKVQKWNTWKLLNDMLKHDLRKKNFPANLKLIFFSF
jgi:hypothetical protein